MRTAMPISPPPSELKGGFVTKHEKEVLKPSEEKPSNESGATLPTFSLSNVIGNVIG